MYVCICHGVTDTQIEDAVDHGIDTMQKVSKELNVGTQCGQCNQCAKKVINNRLLQIAEPVAA